MGALLLLLTAALWGSAFVAQKAGADHLGPFAVLFSRNIVAGIFLLALVSLRRHRCKQAAPLLDRRMLIGGILCGAALFAASLSQQIGIAATTPGVSAFLTANYILLVPVLGLLFGCKTSAFVWLGVVLALVGTFLICIPETAVGFTVGSGEAWTLICALLFAIQILLVDRFAPGTDVFAFSCIEQFVGATLAVPFLMLASERAHYVTSDLTAAIGPLLYLGIVSSGIAYTCQNIGQLRTPPALASVIMSLESVFGVISGYVLMGDQLSMRQLTGSGLVFSAVLLAQIPSFFARKTS